MNLNVSEIKIILSFTILKTSMHLNMSKKGKEKNTDNKAKHSKLIAQKKNKEKSKTDERKARLKAILNQLKENQES